MTSNDQSEMEESSKALWDKDYLLTQVGGNASLVIQLLEIFLADTPNQISGIVEASEQSDTDKISSLAHGLKGAALNLGINSFAATSKKIELEAKSDNIENIKKQLHHLELAFEQVRPILENYKKNQE